MQAVARWEEFSTPHYFQTTISSVLNVKGLSKAYKDLTANGRPSLQQAVAQDCTPLTLLGVGAGPVKYGVVKLSGVRPSSISL